jgi:hypothetical protein
VKKRVLLLGVLSTSLLLLSACAPSHLYSVDKKEGAYFAVPRNWHLISQKDLTKYESLHNTASDAAQKLAELDFQQAYSLGAKVGPSEVFSNAVPSSPIAFLRIRELSADESDLANFDDMRNIFHPFLTVESGTATMLDDINLFDDAVDVQKGGRGISTTYSFPAPDKSTEEVYSQSIILSTDRSRMYMFVVKASSKDYDKYKKTILDIYHSFTVTGKK